jgi:tricorn protease-like protein
MYHEFACLSPIHGDRITFTYGGDLWTASTALPKRRSLRGCSSYSYQTLAIGIYDGRVSVQPRRPAVY